MRTITNIESFAKNLLNSRKKLKFTQATLAEKAGISVQTISAYEKGTKCPSLTTAIDLSNALGVSLDELCSESSTDTDLHSTIGKVESLADIVNLIDHLQKGLSLFERPCTVFSEGANIEIKIENCKDLADYYSKYGQILSLQNDNTIFQEMIIAWKTDMMKRLQSKNTEMFELFGF